MDADPHPRRDAPGASTNFESYFPTKARTSVATGMEQLIGPLQYAETISRGFMVLTVTPTETRADYRYVNTITSKTYTAAVGKTLRTLPGAANQKIVGSWACVHARPYLRGPAPIYYSRCECSSSLASISSSCVAPTAHVYGRQQFQRLS